MSGIPPIPPIPPGAPPYLESSFFSTIIHLIINIYKYSVVVINEATDAASTKAVLTTLVGSIIPLVIILT